jgi:hypothetical protein
MSIHSLTPAAAAAAANQLKLKPDLWPLQGAFKFKDFFFKSGVYLASGSLADGH